MAGTPTQIELIRHADQALFLARIFGEFEGQPFLVFVSATLPTREAAIAQAEEWAVRELGRELPVARKIERLPPRSPLNAASSRLPRTAKSWLHHCDLIHVTEETVE